MGPRAPPYRQYDFINLWLPLGQHLHQFNQSASQVRRKYLSWFKMEENLPASPSANNMRSVDQKLWEKLYYILLCNGKTLARRLNLPPTPGMAPSIIDERSQW